MRDEYCMHDKKGRSTGAQAGKLLCVSETIFPQGSRHGVNALSRYMGVDAGRQTAPQPRTVGGEFVDLRRLHETAPGTARKAGRM